MAEVPTFFVAGATGYTGRAVVAELRRRGLATIAHIRPDSSSRARFEAEFSAIGARIDTTEWDAMALAGALARHAPTAVFCLIGTTAAQSRRAERETGKAVNYETVDYGLTAMLVSAASQSGQKPRFVYLSAAGAAPGAPGAYMQARWKAEEAVRSAGIPYTIVRPSFITGPDRDDNRPGERFGARVADAALNVLGALGARRLQARFRSITNSELAAGLIALAQDPAKIDAIVESDAVPRG
jgi:uncharacterized protein YbjT (DUF2867 family)